MNLSSYILEQALRRLQLPEDSIRQFQLAGKLSDVDGKGFPKELFQLSAPVIVRGLLNFAVLQMKRDWLYPFWVHKQLDPASESYVARSQNPLLINITHRNWTAVGTPHGYHEAIIDPRGLLTPLPREWSVDTWLVVEDRVFFPSLSDGGNQNLDATFPHLTTGFEFNEAGLSLQHFVAQTNHGIDVVFAKVEVTNKSQKKMSGALCIAIRPFNPEGVAPVFSIDFRSPRIAYVNKSTGVVFAETPEKIFCSSSNGGDLSYALRQGATDLLQELPTTSSRCDQGLAHAVAAFRFTLERGALKKVHYSVALADEKLLRRRGTKQTWRVSFDKRKLEQQLKWEREISDGAIFTFADDKIQALFDASRLALLEFNDHNFISPGPFLYHHFWYRDAAVMLRALDLLGFHTRVREVIDAFPERLTTEGFFRGPDGEWDSNGVVLWSVREHFQLNPQLLWLRNLYPTLRRAAQWIVRKRRQTANGLMPKSLSAEHLGTVDQYYWDSFWSLAGLNAMASIATTVNMESEARLFQKESLEFEEAIEKSLHDAARRLGEGIIPATPDRNFDESAIGSISCLYPLELFDRNLPHPAATVRKLREKFVDEKGFLHPFVHSGYNPYLTLQLAHGFLNLDDVEEAWQVADTIFRQATPPYSFPEAIHPRTGGGTMGDGHHGWAAAEIIIFLRDCIVREKEGILALFEGNNSRLICSGRDITLKNIPTKYGPFSCSLSFADGGNAALNFAENFRDESKPSAIDITLPFPVKHVSSSSPNYVSAEFLPDSTTTLRCSPRVRTLLLKLP